MRLGDTSDLPYLPSGIYNSVYAESGNNLNKAVVTCGMMILAQLSYKTHRKLSLQLEVFGKEAFDSFRTFILMTVKEPAFMTVSPIPYSSVSANELATFASDWNRGYYEGTASQQLAFIASTSPNDGSRLGPFGNLGVY